MDTTTLERVKVMATRLDAARLVPENAAHRVEVIEVPDMGKNVDFVAVNDHIFSLAKEEEIRRYIRTFL